MVDVAAAGWVHSSDCASSRVCLNAGAVVCDGDHYAALVPAQHALLLQVCHGVPQPPSTNETRGQSACPDWTRAEMLLRLFPAQHDSILL